MPSYTASYICITCGTNTPASSSGSPLDTCIICDEPRQYVRQGGQEWTTLAKIQSAPKNYHNVFTPTEADPQNMISISTSPSYAIGQRAILVKTPSGNILWDCITYIDEDTITKVKELGGIKAIVISHPHYYSSLLEWSQAFGDVPVYTHKNDQKWVQRPAKNHVFWEGNVLDLLDGQVKAICPGHGHFDGSALLLWNKNLLVADTMMVAASRKSVSFMYSFPNYWPMPPQDVKTIWRSVKPFEVENILGAWIGKEILGQGRKIIFESAKLYTGYSGHEVAKFYDDDAQELAFDA
ncbi:hypothetical protein EDD11_005111 [Mortierella claussenii]|nr:hypothetical protein EDD11_005111 [Mortierella claussenii]